MYKFICVLVFICLWINDASCCMCLPTHPQNAFCKADFVIRAEVTSERQYAFLPCKECIEMDIPFVIAYQNITIKRAFKGLDIIEKVTGENVREPDHDKIKTKIYLSGNDCGTTLDTKKNYLLTGRHIDGRLQMNFCDLSGKWHGLSKQIKDGVHGDYDCSCSVATCSKGNYQKTNVTCVWETEWDEPLDDCTFKHRSCRMRGNECSWDEHIDYQDCYDGLP